MSLLNSNSNCLTMITNVTMLFWPLNASSDSISPGEGGGGLPSIDLRGFAAGKKFVLPRFCVSFTWQIQCSKHHLNTKRADHVEYPNAEIMSTKFLETSSNYPSHRRPEVVGRRDSRNLLQINLHCLV